MEVSVLIWSGQAQVNGAAEAHREFGAVACAILAAHCCIAVIF
jgi:hypothetical protein